MKKSTVKKIIAFMLAIVCVVGVISTCAVSFAYRDTKTVGTSSKDEETTKKSSQSTTESTSSTGSDNKVAKYTVKGAKEDHDTPYIKFVDDGKLFDDADMGAIVKEWGTKLANKDTVVVIYTSYEDISDSGFEYICEGYTKDYFTDKNNAFCLGINMNTRYCYLAYYTHNANYKFSNEDCISITGSIGSAYLANYEFTDAVDYAIEKIDGKYHTKAMAVLFVFVVALGIGVAVATVMYGVFFGIHNAANKQTEASAYSEGKVKAEILNKRIVGQWTKKVYSPRSDGGGSSGGSGGSGGGGGGGSSSGGGGSHF